MVGKIGLECESPIKEVGGLWALDWLHMKGMFLGKSPIIFRSYLALGGVQFFQDQQGPRC